MPTNTTDEFWSANDVSLETYAQNIETFSGSTPPAFRGEDVTIPGMPGQVWVDKVPDSRTITFNMWVRGCNPDGSEPVGKNARQAFRDNWRAIRNLLWGPGQFQLTKRFRVDTSANIKTATAFAEYAGGLEPKMIGPRAAKFSVDLKLADPYFYDDTLTTFNLANGNNTLTLDGDAETLNLLLTINGARTNAIIKRTNGHHPLQVEYHDVLTTGGKVEIDPRAFTARTTPSGSPSFNSIGKIRRLGAPYMFSLIPGTNIINLSSSSGLGTVQLQARGAWI